MPCYVIACERFFLPDAEDLEEHRKTGYPLFSLETGRHLDDFDVIAYDFFDRLWYIIRPGQTPFVAGSVIGNDGDTFTFTDNDCIYAIISI